MGNCTSTKTGKGKKGGLGVKRLITRRPTKKSSTFEPPSKIVEVKEEGDLPEQEKLDRKARLDKLGIFCTKSFIERKHGKPITTSPELQALVRTDQTEASAALLKNYRPLENLLGEGAFGNVYLFQSRVNEKMLYAVKIMFKEDLDPAILKLMDEEVSILAMLDHPNIVKHIESYEDEHNIYIVMEYLEEATELQTIINEQKEAVEKDASKKEQSLFTEDQVSRIMRMIFSGLHHIHTNNVVHRDFKPQNCLMDKNFHLRIIDFGLSKMVQNHQEGQFLLGTPYYLAPEVYNMEGRSEAYRQPLDCWSAGILMYHLISGEYPFDPPDLQDKICTQYVTFSSPRWFNVSAHAKDLIRCLLKKDPADRFSAKQSLDHFFFSQLRQKEQSIVQSEVLDQDIFNRLSGYRSTSQLQKAAFNLLVRSTMERRGSKTVDPLIAKMAQLQLQFQRIDLDGSGSVNARELAQAMKDVNIGMSDEKIDQIIAEIDYVGNGQINYTEFLAATMNFKENLPEEMLMRLFKKFDVDDTGYISKENLIDAFKRLGRSNITLEEVTQMIEAHDIAKDGQVSFQEFKIIFTGGHAQITTLDLSKQDSQVAPHLISLTSHIEPKTIHEDSTKKPDDQESILSESETPQLSVKPATH